MITVSLIGAAALAAADTGASTAYLDRYREVMALAPLRESVAEVSQMNWFFDQWVKGTAIPTYRVAWTDEATPDGRHRVRLRVKQEDVPPEFQAWVLVSADLGQNRFANFRIKVTGAQAEYTSPVLPAAARSVTFNELRSVLADVKMESW